MQLTILADIHGNALALEAVLEDAHRRGLNDFVDLGDVLYGPMEPKRTFELLQSIHLIACVSGNQDRFVASENPGPHATRDFVVQDLGPQPIAWLRNLPPRVRLDELTLFHGSPDSDTTYLLEDISSGTPVVRPEAEILSLLGPHPDKTVFLCGHTHVPRLVHLRSTGSLVLNPGSVGLPAYDDSQPVAHFMETYSPHASYAVLEKSRHGWNVAFHRVAYDWTRAANQARAAGREDWAHGIEFGRFG